MIERTTAFKVGEDVFNTLEEAQQSGLAAIFVGKTVETPNDIADVIMDNSARVIDILTTTPTSKPRARKVNGGTKKRKPAPEAVNAALQDAKQ